MELHKTVGLITIGQSPRPDVTKDFEVILGKEFQIMEGGALDGLSEEEIQSLKPGPGELDLITKLSSGKAVYVSHERLIPYIQRAIDKVVAQGARILVLLCTGEFIGLTAPVTILQPYQVLGSSVASVVAPEEQVVVLVPTPGQVVEAAERWQARGFTVTKTIVISPFDLQTDISNIMQSSEVQQAAAIIGDCFGFDTSFHKEFAAVYHKPIFIPRLLIAHLLKAIL